MFNWVLSCYVLSQKRSVLVCLSSTYKIPAIQAIVQCENTEDNRASYDLSNDN